MSRTSLILLCGTVAAFINVRLQAQDTCSCTRDLEVYIGKVTRNYAGYRDKVNERTQQEYAQLVDSLRTTAASTSDKVKCFMLMDRYRSFFWDKHLQLSGDHKPGRADALRETARAGMVKLTAKDEGNGSLQVDYWRGDLKHIRTTGIHDRGHLALHDVGTLHKIAPLPADRLSAMAFELMYGHEVQWRMLDDTTLYITWIKKLTQRKNIA